MICFKCDNETDFEVQEIEIEQVFLGETIKVITPLTVCKCCGWNFLVKEQLNELMKRMKIKLGEVIEDATDYSVGN